MSRATPVLVASLALELEVAGTVSSASTGVVAVGPPMVKRAELPRNRNSEQPLVVGTGEEGERDGGYHCLFIYVSFLFYFFFTI